MNSKPPWKTVISENMSYKIVSFFIAMILWLTIMGRRDLILTKNIEIEFKTAAEYKVAGQTADVVRLRLSGPRSSLKEIMGTAKSKTLVIDISDRTEGLYDVDIPVNRIDIPQGVRILSVRPNLVRVEVIKSP